MVMLENEIIAAGGPQEESLLVQMKQTLSPNAYFNFLRGRSAELLGTDIVRYWRTTNKA